MEAPEVGFLMFMPDSTVEDLKHNLEFLQRNSLLNRLDRTANLLCHYQIVLMGTSGYRRFEKQGRLTRTGIMGFEREILYLDEGVKWMSELMVHACLYVLRDMSRPGSPIYWRKSGDCQSFKRVNDYLVNLFKRLLEEAQKSSDLPPLKTLKDDIERELRMEIGQVETNEWDEFQESYFVTRSRTQLILSTFFHLATFYETIKFIIVNIICLDDNFFFG